MQSRSGTFPRPPRAYAAPFVALFALASFLPLPSIASADGLAPGRHVLRGKSVAVCNVIGDAKIVQGEGADVVVEVTPRGADGGRLRVVIDECKGQKQLRVVYPSDRVVDPTMGPHEVRQSTLDGCCATQRIHFTRPGEGLDARADLTIHVPRDQKFALTQGTGPIDVTDVRGAIAIDTGGGDVSVTNLIGSLSIDAGSGEISVRKSKGWLAVDAGSGGARIDEFDGTIAIDAGSGGVNLSNVRADKVAIDGGSGGISGDDIVAAVFVIDSGSGNIELTKLNSPRMVFDSGSGGISAGLSRSPESLRIESGSGGVRLTTPRDLDVTFDITCNKRRLDIGVPVVASRVSNEHFEGRAGSGRGLIQIESGSGRVSVQPQED